MTQLDMLDAIAEDRTEFSRNEFPDLERIDAMLQEFAECGYVPKVVRVVDRRRSGRHLTRVFVVGALTPLGEYKRNRLLAEFCDLATTTGA